MNYLALTSLESRTSPLHTIRALLLLSMWPVATNTMHKDMSLVLGGAAIHLAMQNGLHVLGNGQDFARTRLANDETTKTSRAQSWAYCLVVCNCTCLREGIPPLTLPGTLGANTVNEVLLSSFSPEMRTRCEIHNILMSATTALMGGLASENNEHKSAGSLSHLIRLFDSQLIAISSRIQHPMNMIYLQCYRVHLLAYHFLEQSPRRLEGLVALYTVACSLIESVMAQDIVTGLIQYCPIFVERTVFLSAIAILKMHRSSELASIIDSDAGERASMSFAFLVARRFRTMI